MRETFFRSETLCLATQTTLLVKFFVHFKKILIDLKSTVATNHNKQLMQACSASFSALFAASPMI